MYDSRIPPYRPPHYLVFDPDHGDHDSSYMYHLWLTRDIQTPAITTGHGDAYRFIVRKKKSW